MRTTGILSALLTLSMLFFSAVPKISDGDCTTYFPMKQGATFEVTSYNTKDKQQSRTEGEIKKVAYGTTTTATVLARVYDNKDKLLDDFEYDVFCENGVFKIDLQGLINNVQMQQLKEMENMQVAIESEHLELPSNMKPGDQLKDARITISINTGMQGMENMQFTTRITNRKVEAKEKVTTPAGTFDCLRIRSDIESKTGFGDIRMTTIDWFCENVGMVKTETYNGDKKESYSLLTKLKL